MSERQYRYTNTAITTTGGRVDLTAGFIEDGINKIERHQFSVADVQRIDPPESPDERLQRVERCMLALTQEWLELTGRAEPPMPVARVDVGLIRDEDIEVRSVGRPNPGGQHVGTYSGVCAVHTPTGIAILVDDERSQMRNRKIAVGRLRGTIDALNDRAITPSTLSPAEWSALFELRRDIENDAPRSSALNEARSVVIASAIDKLRTQAHEAKRASPNADACAACDSRCNCDCGGNYCGCRCHRADREGA